MVIRERMRERERGGGLRIKERINYVKELQLKE